MDQMTLVLLASDMKLLKDYLITKEYESGLQSNTFNRKISGDLQRTPLTETKN